MLALVAVAVAVVLGAGVLVGCGKLGISRNSDTDDSAARSALVSLADVAFGTPSLVAAANAAVILVTETSAARNAAAMASFVLTWDCAMAPPPAAWVGPFD
jgi:hypothetical protein